MMKNSTKATETLIIGAGFSGLYLAFVLLSYNYDKFLVITPNTKTVSDKSYYNFRSKRVKQESLKKSILRIGQGKCNRQLVDILVNNIDSELDFLGRIAKLKPSYLGAQVINPRKLLEKLRKKSQNHRIYGEIIKAKKTRNNIIVKTTKGIINCKKLIFCTGGNRASFSQNFNDEKTFYDAFKVAEDIGCRTESLNKIMYHPFYSRGVCLPSDMLSDFDIVNEKDEKLNNVCKLLKAHNAHHRLKKIVKECGKQEQYFAVKNDIKIKLSTEPHYTLGGIKINKYGQTNIKNIYALGECSFGMHGYERIGGCAMSEIIVVARIIAKKLIN